MDLTDDAMQLQVRFEARKDSVMEQFLSAPTVARPGKLQTFAGKSPGLVGAGPAIPRLRKRAGENCRRRWV